MSDAEKPFQPAFRRVLLKLSGESFCREGQNGISMAKVESVAAQIRRVADSGVQLAIVCGGGNILRGKEFSAVSAAINAPTAHYMGMLATVINALAVQDALESLGVPTRVQSAVAVDRVCEKFIRRRALRHLEKGRVVIFAGGTGNPYVTTDSCAALRASEIGADVVLKATKVDGVYSADPLKDPKATLFDRLSYDEVLDRRLGVMDVSAIDMCRRNHIPIVVFNLKIAGHMRDVVLGKPIGTLVDAG